MGSGNPSAIPLRERLGVTLGRCVPREVTNVTPTRPTTSTRDAVDADVAQARVLRFQPEVVQIEEKVRRRRCLPGSAWPATRYVIAVAIAGLGAVRHLRIAERNQLGHGRPRAARGSSSRCGQHVPLGSSFADQLALLVIRRCTAPFAGATGPSSISFRMGAAWHSVQAVKKGHGVALLRCYLRPRPIRPLALPACLRPPSSVPSRQL